MTQPEFTGADEAQRTLDFIVGIFLLVVAVILAFVVLFFSFLGIVYYQHPDDMDQARGSRWVAVFALWLVYNSGL